MQQRMLVVMMGLSLSAACLGASQLGAWLWMPLVLALSVLGSGLLMRSWQRALQPAVRLADEIANGQLGHQMEAQHNDDAGALLTALLAMDHKLNEIVGGVRVNANAAGLAARQLAQGSHSLSARTQHQAAALEETAASIEQLTATVKQNAAQAFEAQTLGASVATQAESSAAVVHKAIVAMQDIRAASRQIAEIVGVIDAIAFQTNLLALNAAVEAARAGDQGRGFAVVAAEVRALAQRSADAAKQIKGLIQGSVEKMQVGAELVVKSGDSLFAITGDVKRVTTILAEIATASQEQATGVMQVSDAVMQLDSVTQQNAALAGQTAGTSKVLEQQASALIQQIGFFRRARHTYGEGETSAAHLIEEILIHQRENARLAMNVVIARDPEVTRGASANIRHNRDCIAALWQQYRPGVHDTAEQQLADSYWALRIEFIATIEEAMRLASGEAYEAAQQLVMSRLSAVSSPMFRQGDALKTRLETHSQPQAAAAGILAEAAGF